MQTRRELRTGKTNNKLAWRILKIKNFPEPEPPLKKMKPETPNHL
jgi:hypothetical protein